MLLFLHGSYQSNSSFLPLIRTLLNLNSQYSDKFILDTFTIQMPGYHCEDSIFDTKIIDEKIKEFVVQKKPVQYDISSKLILTKNNPAVVSLKNSKLDLVGYTAGGNLALYFASQNPNTVSSIFLINSALKFDGIKAKWKRRQTNKELKHDIAFLQTKMDESGDFDSKVFYSLLVENSNRVGIKSYMNFMYEHDFGKIFQSLTISQQHDFVKIPIFVVYGSKESLLTMQNIRNLSKLLDTNNNLVTQKHTIINTNTELSNPNFIAKKSINPNQQMLEKDNLVQLITLMQDFLRVA